MDQIVEHGKVIRGYLGVSIQDVDPDMAKAFGLPHGGGALIGDVTPDTPAATAGIQRGDVVLELNGQPVNGPDELSVRVSQMAPGSVAHLKVFRNGESKDMDVTLGEYPEKAAAKGEQGEAAPAGLKGIHVQDLTPEIARQLQLPASTVGVVVSSIDPASSAAEAGLQRGDIIQEVNRKPVRNVEQYRQVLAGLENQSVLLLINRGGTTHFLMVQPQ
jgi:serine protease Do